MHSHQRTLLSRMGFGDVDLKEPLHDWICQFMNRESSVREALDAACPCFTRNHCGSNDFIHVQDVGMETRIKGKSGGTVGFADVTAQLDCFMDTRDRIDFERGKGLGPHSGDRYKCAFLLEVKVHRTSLGDVIRQLKLYRDFFCPERESIFLLLTTYDLDTEDVKSLEKEGIFHLYPHCVEGLIEYVKSRRDRAWAESGL